MKISIDFDGIQEGKNYVFQFSLSSNGQVVIADSTTPTSQVAEKKENGAPSLEDFEDKEKPPELGKPGTTMKRDFKVESSFDGKLDEGKNL
jgi:hypothetical protein